MPRATRPQIIDADTHVIETRHTWDYLEASERKYRPKLFSTPEDSTREYWVLDDKITDYGHTDPSSAGTALQELQRMEGIDSSLKEKILWDNAKALYGW
ncbi:MAG TPA: hypothetical protein VGH22_03895 [Candidatus Binatia bacterium]|jgi:predicted TIM-barrel fold metal-dependent hydrolase